MISDIQNIYDDILKDPGLFESIVEEYCIRNPKATKEEIHIRILKLISIEYLEEADQDKRRRQLDITRDRIASKALTDLPDSDSPTSNKAKIKSSFFKVSTSGTGHDREELADSLKDFADTQGKRISKRKIADDDIERRK